MRPARQAVVVRASSEQQSRRAVLGFVGAGTCWHLVLLRTHNIYIARFDTASQPLLAGCLVSSASVHLIFLYSHNCYRTGKCIYFMYIKQWHVLCRPAGLLQSLLFVSPVLQTAQDPCCCRLSCSSRSQHLLRRDFFAIQWCIVQPLPCARLLSGPRHSAYAMALTRSRCLCPAAAAALLAPKAEAIGLPWQESTGGMVKGGGSCE